MGYEIAGVVARAGLLAAAARELPMAVPAPLRQGFALLPMTDELFDAVTDDGTAGAGRFGFWKFPSGFDRTLLAWSEGGPLAYIEAEFFGGVGSQRAAVWSAGELILGPIAVKEREAFAEAGSPISQALRALGAAAGDGADEFDAVGLNAHRHIDDWL
jgi:hypothetical protein